MKKYQVVYGWQPPKEERIGSNRRIFYNTEQKVGIREIQDPETDEVTTEEYTYWLCDVIEFTFNELLKKDFNRWKLIECIKAYDSSHCINEFTINGIPMWLDKDTRTGLQLRFEAEIAMGKAETTLWSNGQSFTLPLDKAMEMLKAIEVYASKCYNVTQEHLHNIATLEDTSNYDYKIGYPNKLEL